MTDLLDDKKLSPMMEQWRRCKEQAKEALLLFRMGDFYEAFYEDAHVLAQELELTLTKRQGIPMSGVPWHTGESYIDQLVAKGYRVAIAEQVEDPRHVKGLVKREIVRYVTPGTLINSTLLTEKSHNFIGALTQVGSIFGLAICDLTTATFRVVEIEEKQELLNELYRLQLAELIISKKFRDKMDALLQELPSISLFYLDDWRFEPKTATQLLTQHFKVSHLDGFGLKSMIAAIHAAGALLAYISEELALSIAHIKEIKPYSVYEHLLMDRTCQLNLELTESLYKTQNATTLLEVIDTTLTPMGGRLLAEWLKKPLIDLAQIQERQECVAELLTEHTLLHPLPHLLKEVRDVERLLIKICSGYATPRDLNVCTRSLEGIGPIKRILHPLQSSLWRACREQLVELPDLVQELKSALVDDPPLRITEGNLFRTGYNAALDELRHLMTGGKEWLSNYQTQLKEQSGIKNLKVGFNKIFGYYIEVSKGQAHLMPSHCERRQTLVNCERFVSPILKEYESKVLSAEEQALSLEQELFAALRSKVAAEEEKIAATAQAVATIDALLSLTRVAKTHSYCRPRVDDSRQISIIEGRHPILSARYKETFIPNDLHLDGEQQMMLITGPNMAGKSTYIRQVALIVILAQMGGFVPAKEAHIGVIDRIFTRIGASDDLSRGQSTFMVEMSETAHILNNLTPRSLVILDEIGRGTSTYDGVSIAWSVAEYLLKKGAKTLFATHYGELTHLVEKHGGVSNYHAAVQEWNEEIVFLHKILKGAADRSYGIHVARLAGLPPTVIQRATALLKKFESTKESRSKQARDIQLSFF